MRYRTEPRPDIYKVLIEFIAPASPENQSIVSTAAARVSWTDMVFAGVLIHHWVSRSASGSGEGPRMKKVGCLFLYYPRPRES